MKNLLFILFILLCSCNGQPSYIDGHTTKKTNGDISYIKDNRTGLCFAERGVGESYTFTCVECTKEVESLIEK